MRRSTQLLFRALQAIHRFTRVLIAAASDRTNHHAIGDLRVLHRDRDLVAQLLHKDVKVGAVLVERTPQQIRFTAQRDEHLVKVLRAIRLALDIAQTQLKVEMPAHSATDDLGWETMTVVERFRILHHAILRRWPNNLTTPNFLCLLNSHPCCCQRYRYPNNSYLLAMRIRSLAPTVRAKHPPEPPKEFGISSSTISCWHSGHQGGSNFRHPSGHASSLFKKAPAVRAARAIPYVVAPPRYRV